MSRRLPLSVALTSLLLAACNGNGGGFAVYNTPPSATISTPASGTAFVQYETVTMSGRVGDDQDAAPDLSITWNSSIDGELPGSTAADADGYVSYSTANLSAGNHVISLTVVDSEGESSKSEVTLTINDLPESPQITIIHPVTGESGLEGEEYTFQIAVSDSKDAPGDILVEFDSDVDGVFCTLSPDGAGLAQCDQELTAGEHFLTFRATDTDGEVGSATAYFTVVSRSAFDDDGDGWNEDQGDCDDDDDEVYPGATEEANGEDDDCDDVIDNGTPGYDDDGDGYSENTGDCDDADATVYPGAPETYDGDDEDCDSLVDEGTSAFDDDGDTWTETAGDCDDAYALTFPGATELEDSRDNDCDGLTDEGTDAYDDDGDGYTEHGGDCEDDDDEVHPGATETCGDGVDNDCNGEADEENASGCISYYRDYDSDAYGTTTSACLCSGADYYTSRYNTDCYDYNASANPGTTSYFSAHRGDSSFDYNCDSTETKYYTTTGGCSWDTFSCDRTAGWNSGVASCGTTAAYVTGCDEETILGIPVGCDNETTSYTQTCR